MKLILIIAPLLSLAFSTHVQTYDEWFRQKKTQRKYLLQQIAALQTYLGHVKKGYNILNNGLQTIGDIKNGDWTLHRLFLDKRTIVSPKIKSYSRIVSIIAMQAQTIARYRNWKEQMKHYPLVSAAQMQYYQRWINESLQSSEKLLSELLLLVTDGAYAMTDAERINRIEHIYRLHTRESTHLLSFCDQTAATTAHRQQVATEMNRLQNLY